MKKSTENNMNEILISTVDLENANLNEWDRLELHLLDQAAVVIPGNMTAMELIRTVEALQELVSDLQSALVGACDRCDNCQMDKPCRLMTGPILPRVSIPDHVLEEAGLDPDCKLVCTVEQGSGEVRVVEADHSFDLTDLQPDLVDILRERKVCLANLEEKLIREEVIYGADTGEVGGVAAASEGTKSR